MTNVLSIYDETKVITDLRNESLELIHCTRVVAAIKRLITAHDIFEMSLLVYERFKEIDEVPLDKAILLDLRSIKSELVVFYRDGFDPPLRLDRYASNVGEFLSYSCFKYSWRL